LDKRQGLFLLWADIWCPLLSQIVEACEWSLSATRVQEKSRFITGSCKETKYRLDQQGLFLSKSATANVIRYFFPRFLLYNFHLLWREILWLARIEYSRIFKGKI
jgi:hypothetical protein